MNLKSFIVQNGLESADAIILRKKLLGMVDHYAIFLGYRSGIPVFVANFRDGVQEVALSDMREVLQTLQPTAIEKFEGTEIERKQAVQRALSRVGEQAYSYFKNNCEHFKNWVHSGEHLSEQVDTAGNVALVLGGGAVVAAVASENPKLGAAAIGLLLFGLFLKDAAS